MEDLKRYIVDYQITYHCIGRRGLFHKKEYSFDFSLRYDELTHFITNACTTQRALAKTRPLVEKKAMSVINEKDKYFRIVGNTPENKFKKSPRVYWVNGVDIKLIKVSKGIAWKDLNVRFAMEHLSVDEFKRVYNNQEGD